MKNGYRSGGVYPRLVGGIMNVGDIFRKATRPIVTVIFACVIAQVVVDKIDAPGWFIGLAGTVIVFWFGERAGLRIKYHGKDTEEKK